MYATAMPTDPLSVIYDLPKTINKTVMSKYVTMFYSLLTGRVNIAIQLKQTLKPMRKWIVEMIASMPYAPYIIVSCFQKSNLYSMLI